MKKGLCIILSALMIALTFSACSKKGGDDAADVTTQVNEEGSVYVNVTEENGVEKTDKEGEEVTSVLSDEEASKIDKQKEKTTSTTLKLDEDLLSGMMDEDAALDITAAAEDILPEGTTTKNTTIFEDKVQKTIKSGKFTLDMNVASGGTKMPMKLVFDEDRMYATFTFNGVQCGFIYMDGKTYILMPNLFIGSKVYMEFSEADESMKEMFDSFGDISGNGGTYVGSSTVKVGKTEYICEEYKNEDGDVFKYYFQGKDWKRYECKTADGNMVYEINDFSSKVDKNVFSLKGYTKMSEDSLESLLGGGMGAGTGSTTTTTKKRSIFGK